jgi:hypothetical protein
MSYNKKYFHLLFLSIILSVLPIAADASVLYFNLENKQYQQGDVFLAEIKLNTQGENINLGDISVNFNPENLKVINISSNNSIFTLWLKNPVFLNENGIISFTGGVPGKFKGDANVLSVYFMAQKTGQTNIDFDKESKILLSDGIGSSADLTTQAADILILPSGSAVPKNDWENQIKNDQKPPENFKTDIAKIDGKYFLIFSTTDAGSGIDYYEVKEGRGNWQKAESPYLLKNQSLRSKISVRAADKAGNMQVSEILPKQAVLWWVLISLITLLLVTTLSLILFKRNKGG